MIYVRKICRSVWIQVVEIISIEVSHHTLRSFVPLTMSAFLLFWTLYEFCLIRQSIDLEMTTDSSADDQRKLLFLILI